MLQKPSFIITELILLFIALPIFLTLDIPSLFKVVFTLTGVVYCIWISLKLKLIDKKSLYQIESGSHLKRIALTFMCIALASYTFMYFLHPEDLFVVVIKRPLLWLFILFFYATFSVYPQELLYRSFFFSRYQGIFKNNKHLILVNVLVFPIAHLFFDNWLVLLVTLIGGIFFTTTYHKSKSVLLTSIEHAIYGNWLFTIGMGEMLAFPMPQ